MKKLFVLTAVGFILLTGCDKRAAPAQPPAQTNNFGTLAIELSENAASIPAESVSEYDGGAVSSSVSGDAGTAASTSDNDAEEEDKVAGEEINSNVVHHAPMPDNNDAEEESTPPPSSPSVDIEIKDKLFIAQVNDIYLNAEDYLGKTIKYEGVVDSYTWEEENKTYYAVIRYGPGCCGNDGNVGFEILWDGGYPPKNDWVEVIGTLEVYEEDGWQYLRLNLSSLTVLPTRGAEYVSQ